MTTNRKIEEIPNQEELKTISKKFQERKECVKNIVKNVLHGDQYVWFREQFLGVKEFDENRFTKVFNEKIEAPIDDLLNTNQIASKSVKGRFSPAQFPDHAASKEAIKGIAIAPIFFYGKKADDPKLAPIKLVFIRRGKIIPIHDHKGSEFVIPIVGTQSDLKRTYGEGQTKEYNLTNKGHIHAITSITPANEWSVSLVMLPDENTGLDFGKANF